MAHKEGEGYSVDPITREDLDKHTADIKEHLDLKLAPIVKDQAKAEKVLHGTSGRNGVVGDQKTMQTNLKVVYGLLVFVSAGLVKIIFF